MGQLPNFEELVALAERDPDAFNLFRQSVCEQFIATTPSPHRQRLAAVQNRVEMELRRAKTPLAGLIKVSGMMHDSLYQLSSQWIEFDRVVQRPLSAPPRPAKTATIISLHAWKNQQQAHPGSVH